MWPAAKRHEPAQNRRGLHPTLHGEVPQPPPGSRHCGVHLVGPPPGRLPDHLQVALASRRAEHVASVRPTLRGKPGRMPHGGMAEVTAKTRIRSYGLAGRIRTSVLAEVGGLQSECSITPSREEFDG